MFHGKSMEVAKVQLIAKTQTIIVDLNVVDVNVTIRSKAIEEHVIILSPLDPSLTPPQLLHKSQTSLFTRLPTKYYNKTNVSPNITNFDVYF
jgi:hypothetical protein